jgi:hypothetical protein
VTPFLESALSLAARGFRVFPLIPGTKRPAIERWQELATRDPEIIKRAWGERAFNIGVLCGGGLLVLDVDVKDGKPGLASLEALGIDQDTYTVETPSGGLHVYYQGPDVPNSAGRIAPGLDIRSAGGYVVGVGSVCEGQPYRLVRNGKIRTASAAFVARCGDKTQDRKAGVRDDLPSGAPPVELDDEAAVLRGRDWLRDTAPLFGSYAVAARLKDFGVSEDTALQLMLDHWNDRRPKPHTMDTLAGKVQHAYRYGQNPPGSEHPSVAFAGVHVDPPPQPALNDLFPAHRHNDAYDIAKTHWLFHSVLAADGTALLIGPSQAGKTFVIVELARCLATGKPFFGIKPDEIGGTVVLFSGSEGSGWPLRLAALEETDTLPITALKVPDLTGRGVLDKLVLALKEESARMQLLFGVPLRMVVLETLSASGLLLDENSNSEASRAWTNLNTIADMLGLTFIASHHPPKEGRGARGAGALTASPNGLIEIFREGRDAVRRIEVIKARNAEQRVLGSYTLVPVHLGTDAKGRPVTSMTVSMGEPVMGRSRAPNHMSLFMQALEFADVDAGKVVEGLRMIPTEDAKDAFKDVTEEAIPDPSNRRRTWNKCIDHATAMGVVESRAVHGVHYLIRKEIT